MLYTSPFSPATAIRLLDKAPARWHHAAMQTRSLFRRAALLLLVLAGTLSTPAPAELVEATVDELMCLVDDERENGIGSETDTSEWHYVLISPDGLTKAAYTQDAFGAAYHEFRVYHKRGDKWYTGESQSSSDYSTHGFATRYANVNHVRMTNDSIELTVTDEDYGITFTETLPLSAESHFCAYRSDRMLRHHPLHEAAMRGNANQIRALLASDKVNPCLLDFDAKYAWEVAANDECRTLLQQAAGEPNRPRDIPATLRYLRGLNENDAFASWDLKTLEEEQQAWEKMSRRDD